MRFDSQGRPVPVYICKPGERPYGGQIVKVGA